MNRLPNTLIQFFEEVYLESQLNQVLDEGEKQKTDTQTNNNWSEEMKKLKGLLTAPVELEQIPFTEENLNKLGKFIQTPIEKVYLSNIGPETLFRKMNRKAGGRGDIDRRQFIDAIPKVLSNPAFIGICLVIFIGQILIVQFGGDVFRTEPLNIETWLEIVGLTAIVPVCRELLYWIKKLFK